MEIDGVTGIYDLWPRYRVALALWPHLVLTEASLGYAGTVLG